MIRQQEKNEMLRACWKVMLQESKKSTWEKINKQRRESWQYSKISKSSFISPNASFFKLLSGKIFNFEIFEAPCALVALDFAELHKCRGKSEKRESFTLDNAHAHKRNRCVLLHCNCSLSSWPQDKSIIK